MIALTARVEAHPPQRRELVQALLQWSEGVRREEGAVSCHLSEDLENVAVFDLKASWANETSLRSHMRSERFGVLLGALQVLARPVRFEVLVPAEGSGVTPEGRFEREERG